MMTPEEALTEVKARLRAARIQRLVTGMRSAIYRLSRDLNYDLGHALLGGKVLEEGWMEPGFRGTGLSMEPGRQLRVFLEPVIEGVDSEVPKSATIHVRIVEVPS